MAKLGKCILSLLLSVLLVLSSLYILPLTVSSEGAVSARDIEITLAADAVSNNLSLAGFSEKLKAELLTTYGIATDKVHITTVDSSSNSTDSITWNRFDHTNNAGLAAVSSNSIVSYYNEYYSNLSRDYHVVLSGGTIDFYGYSSPAYKDFLYSPNSNANNKIFSFTMDEAIVDYHTGEGAGFLFNAKYTYNSDSDRRLSCYMVLLGQSYIYLFRLDNIEVGQFINETYTGLGGVAYYAGYSGSQWGGTVTNIATVSKPASSSGTKRYLKLVASPESVSFYQFTDETYTTVKNKMLEGVSLPDSFNSFGFGPICSYLSHGCSSLTNIRFSDVKLTEDTSVGFAETVRSTNWQYDNSLKVFINVDNDGVSDFGSTAKLSSILYYTMLNNAHYIGWGINNTINIGGYTSVKTQSDGFATRNNGLGTFISRTESATYTLDQGVTAIAAYIANQLALVPELENPTLNTTISNGSVTCAAPDLLTSNGNPISTYDWKCLDIATGTWSNNTDNTSSSSFTFPQNTYKMIGLRIKDSVTEQWSDYSYAYIATVANVEPVSQFTLDKTTLMPDSSIAALNTGSTVIATDTSYLPNGNPIAGWEWTVCDQSLALIPAMAKTYNSATKPSSITFDFAGKSAGTYTIKLRTKNSAAVWSNYYSQKVIIYSESASSISIGTTNDTVNTNSYTGTATIPFTVSSTGGNITSYRIIRALIDSTMEIGDWTKVNSALVSSTTSITNTPCTVYVQAIDATGNSKTQSIGKYVMPISVSAFYEGGNTAYPESTRTNRTVVLKSSNEYLQYSTDNGSTWTHFVSPLSVTTSLTFQFRYIGETDPAGYFTFITDIHKTMISSLGGFTNNSVYKTDITPVFSNVTAALSKNSGISSAFTSGTTLTDDGRYTLALSDAYGNLEIYSFTIDKTLPTILVSGNPTSWKNQNQTIAFIANDAQSGVATVSVTGSISGDMAVTLQDGTYHFTAAQNETCTISVTDIAGNTATSSVVVEKIDKTSPSISTPSGNPSSWTNQDQTISFGISEPLSGIASLTVSGSVSGNMTLTQTDGTYHFTASKNETFTISATDNAGNLTTAAVEVTKIDKTKPFISDPDGNPVAWTNQNQTITFITTSALSGISSVLVSGSISGPRTVTNNTGTYSFIATQNEIYTITVTDQAGNVTETPITVSKIDKITPTGSITIGENAWSEFLNTITFGIFFKETIQVEIEGTDGQSDIQKIEYYQSTVMLSLDQVKAVSSWSLYSGDFSVTPANNARFIYYVKITDHAGNVSYISSNGASFDTTNPTITGVISGSTYHVDQIIMAADTNLESLTVNGNPFTNGSALPADQDATYVIIATDKAGNSLTVTVYAKTIESLDDDIEALTLTTVKSSDKALLQAALGRIDGVLDTTGNGAPQSQIDKLDTMRQDISSLLEKITEIADTISAVNTQVLAITVANVKNTDKSVIDSALATINELLDDKTGNLTDTEKSALEQTKAILEDSLVRIKAVADAIIDINTRLDGITADNIKSSDKADLDHAAATIKDLLENKTGNLTDSEKAAVELKKVEVDGLLSKIKEITDTMTDLKTRTVPITEANVKTTDKAILEDALLTAIDLLANKSGNLTDNEIKELEDRKIAIEDGLAVIKALEDTIADISAQTILILPENVKSSDKALLETILAALDDLLNHKAGNLTDVEKTALEERKADIEKELVKIKSIADTITDIITIIRDITLDNVKSSDKTNLADVLRIISDLLDNQYGNLTVTEKSALEKQKVDVGNAFVKIQQIADAIKDANNKVPGITEDNVTKNDATNLEDARDTYQKILTDYAGNLTESEKKQAEEKLQAVKSVIASLDEVKAVEAQIEALPDAKDVTKDHAAAIEKANKAFGMLSTYQQTLLDQAIIEKLETAVIALKALLLQDDATGTKVEGVDGTVFDINTELSVTPIRGSLDEKTMSLYNFGIQSVADGQEIVQLYDIKLMLGGVAIQPDGKVKITLKLTEAMKMFSDLKVVYIADDGNVTIIPFERNDTEVWFVTDHFSNYGIIGTPPDSVNVIDTVLITLIMIAAIAIPTLGILLFVRRGKKKEAK